MVIRDSDKFFYCCDGAVLKSAKEMLDWLRTCSCESFENHVNDEKNDFVLWIRDVLKDNVLARRLFSCKDREEMIDEISKRLESNTKSTKKNLIQEIKQAMSHGKS